MNARLLALLPAAIAINLVIGGLVNALGLPLYLDSIGTILATVLAGPAVGVLAGAIGHPLFGLTNGYQWIPLRLIPVVIAIACFIALWKYKQDIMKVIGVCALLGLALSFVR